MDRNSLKALINSLNRNSENEVIELKEAKNSYKTRDIGRYFSAISNEVNLKGLQSGFLIFGVRDDGTVCGTSFMQEDASPSIGLNRLKKEIADYTNNRITFRDIFEESVDSKRVVVFEIPAATRGIPTQWAGAAWAREGESLVPLPMNKIDEIRSQPPHDWSRRVVEDATIEDLDPHALQIVRKKFEEKYGDREGLIDNLDDMELLDKAGITYRGQITNTALLLVGRSESTSLIVGALPKITWTLYESDGSVRSYQHFKPPFIITIDDVLLKIRNEERTVFLREDSLLPTSVREYDNQSLRELICNSIAHQAYEAGGKINIEEFPDKIVFLNEGMFIPGSLETALGNGYKPPYYRNPFLADAMIQVGMLDQNSMGIVKICKNAQSRFMPLPTYVLDDPQRVKVELPNHEINNQYTFILHENPELPILTVLALDKVQKNIPLSSSERDDLLDRGFVHIEGDDVVFVQRLFVRRDVIEERSDSFLESEEPALTKKGRKYLAHASLEMVKKEILELIDSRPLSRNEIDAYLKPLYIHIDPGFRDVDTKGHTYRVLKKLEEEKRIVKHGETRAALWYPADAE